MSEEVKAIHVPTYIKLASEKAPDLIDDTYGERASSCVITLLLLGVMKEGEAISVNHRIEEWKKNIKVIY